MRARALAAGTDAHRTLAGGATTGRVIHAITGGAYLHFADDRWIFLGHPRTPMGPLSLRLDRPITGLVRPDDPVRLTRDALTAGRLHVPLNEEACDTFSLTPPTNARNTLVADGIEARGVGHFLMQHLPAEVPDEGPRMRHGRRCLARGAIGEAVDALAGYGPGLTPEGDDVLIGFAAWRAARGIAELGLHQMIAGRSSSLAGAYLRCAERGEVAEPIERVIREVGTGTTAGIRRAVRALAGWGASSGVATLRGMAAAGYIRPLPS